MRPLIQIFVCATLLAFACGQEGQPPITIIPSTSTTPASNVTTKPTTPPSPPTPPPTTKPTPPPTTKPTTPAPTPPPTTKPTTPAPTPPPTTKPTTPVPTPPPTTKPTTPAPPTPAPKPPKKIDPATGDWRVNYTTPETGSCIIAHMGIQIEVPYNTMHNKTWHAYVNLHQNATAEGNCAKLAESLTLKWLNNSIRFDFKTIENKTWYIVDKVSLTIDKNSTDFPDIVKENNTQLNLVYNKPLFNTTQKMSYKCTKTQTFNLTLDNSNETMAYLHIGHLQLQSFGAQNTTGFADYVDCEPSGTPDIIPIAAGCALAALIIIVLGAYLIGRKRSQARGYLSMFTETKREEDYIPMKNLSCFN